MTAKQELIRDLSTLHPGGDREEQHLFADNALLLFLKRIGHEDVVNAFKDAREVVLFGYRL